MVPFLTKFSYNQGFSNEGVKIYFKNAIRRKLKEQNFDFVNHVSMLAVCLSNVRALTSRNPMGLHGP
jgi:hypothetical protein